MDCCWIGLIGRWEEKPINVPVKSIDVQCEAFHQIVNVTTQLVYLNETENNLECGFVFPLDEGAAIYHFEAQLNNRVIVAEIQGRVEARNTYERAVEEKKTAFLLEQDTRCADTFKISLGNLPPKSEARLTLKYVQELEMLTLSETEKSDTTAALTFILPSVLNPRYDPEPTKAEFDRDILLNANPYKLTFSATLNGSMVIQRVEGRTDEFDLQFLNETHSSAKVLLKETSELARKHDLELQIYYTDVFQPHVIYERGDVTAAAPNDNPLMNHVDVALLNFLPNLKLDPSTSAVKKELNEFVFVIDQSGSMYGTRIERAKETLLLLLKSLPVGCFFQIIGFGDTFQSSFPQPAEYNEENLKVALTFQEKIDAELGGTEILRPLQDIYSKPVRAGFARSIFLLTDGEVSNPDEVIKLVKTHAGNTTVFSVGIGEGASTALIKGVARASGGRAEFVRDEEKRFASKILDLLKASMDPRISNVKVNITVPQGVSFVRVPNEISNIFNGRLFTQFLLLQGDLKQLETHEAKVSVSGDIGGVDWSFEFKVNRNASVSNASLTNRCIHRVSGKRQIQLLEEEEEIKEISKAFNIISAHTSFVGVDSETKDVLPEPEVQYPRFAMYGMPMAMACCAMPRMLADPVACFTMPLDYDSATLECLVADDSVMEEAEQAPPPPPPVVFGSKTIAFASFQLFNGLWKAADTKVWEQLELDRDAELSKKPDGWTDDEFVTILVVSYLVVRCAEDIDEWQLFVEKAKSCLSANRPANLVESFLTEHKSKLITAESGP